MKGASRRANLIGPDLANGPPSLVAAYLIPEDGILRCAFEDARSFDIRLERLRLPPGAPIAFALIDEFGTGIDFVREDGTRTSCGADLILHLMDAAYRESQRGHRTLSDEELALRVGQRVSSLRQRQALSQRDLARRLKIAPPNLARIEKGKHLPNVATLVSLAESLGCSLADLISSRRQPA